MKTKTLLLAFFLQYFSAAPNVSAAAYAITDLGPLHPLSVNESGQMSGFVTRAYESPAAWLNGSLIELQPAVTGGYACAINNTGTIAGWLASDGAVTWNCAGQATLLPAGPSAYAPEAVGLNDQGLIVGHSYQGYRGGLLHACCWNNGVYTDLGVPSGNQSAAVAVNRSGTIVVNGWYSTIHAYLYRNGSFTPLLTDVPGLSECQARAINDAGAVLAWGRVANGPLSACLWQDGVTTWLPDVLGKAVSDPIALNNYGVVVGYGYNNADADSVQACVWDHGQVTYLDDLVGNPAGWQFNYADDINDAGQIVGEGMLDGVYHGFLLTPVPEPSSLALLGVGALCAWSFIRRQHRSR
jgi:uncharacterized membrane protein